jgi:hypothetical protein
VTAPHPEPDLEPLRRSLRARARGQKPGHAERLAQALTGEPDSALSCAEVQERLPAYADAELRGVLVSQRYPEVAQHLLACNECGPLYALMLDRELAPASEPLPAPAPLKVLRQEARFEEVRHFVVRIAEAALKTVRPAAVPGLADATQVFFDQVRELGREFRLEPTTTYAMGQGGDLSPAVRFLMASFLATQRLAQEAPTARSSVPSLAGDLGAMVRQTALRAATDSGLKGAEAKRFAGAYASLVAQGGMTWPEWPANE